MANQKFFKSLLVLVSTLFLSLPTMAQRDFSNVDIVANHVAGSFYYLQGAGAILGCLSGMMVWL